MRCVMSRRRVVEADGDVIIAWRDVCVGVLGLVLVPVLLCIMVMPTAKRALTATVLTMCLSRQRLPRWAAMVVACCDAGGSMPLSHTRCSGPRKKLPPCAVRSSSAVMATGRLLTILCATICGCLRH